MFANTVPPLFSLTCPLERSILLGPIVGRVTARTVVLLVEVDQAGPVTVYLSRTDLPTNPPPLGKEVCRVTQVCFSLFYVCIFSLLSNNH